MKISAGKQDMELVSEVGKSNELGSPNRDNSEHFPSCQGQKRSSGTLDNQHEQAGGNHGKSTTEIYLSSKKRKQKIDVFPDRTGHQHGNRSIPPDKSDFSMVKVKEEVEDCLDPSCIEMIKTSSAFVDVNNIKIEEEVDETEPHYQFTDPDGVTVKIEDRSDHGLNPLCEYNVQGQNQDHLEGISNIIGVAERIKQEIEEFPESENLNASSSTAGKDKMGSFLPSLPFPDYEGRSRTTRNYVKIYREGTLRAMAAIANEQAAVAAKQSDPAEPVQAKKILSLEFLSRKPKVSNVIKHSILEGAKANFEGISASSNDKGAKKKTGDKMCGSTEVDLHVGSQCKTNLESRERREHKREVKVLSQIAEETIQKLETDLEFFKHFGERQSPKGRGKGKKQLVDELKGALKSLECARKLGFEELDTIYAITAKAPHLLEMKTEKQLPDSDMHFAASTLKNDIAVLKRETPSEEWGVESGDLFSHVMGPTEILHELESQKAGGKLAQEMKKLIKVLEKVESLDASVKKRLAHIELSFSRTEARTAEERCEVVKDKYQEKICCKPKKEEEDSPCTLESRKTVNLSEFKRSGEPVRIHSSLTVSSRQPRLHQLLKFQKPTLDEMSHAARKPIYYQRSAVKKSMSPEEVETELRREQELAKKQLASLSAKPKLQLPKDKSKCKKVTDWELNNKLLHLNYAKAVEEATKATSAGEPVKAIVQPKIAIPSCKKEMESLKDSTPEKICNLPAPPQPHGLKKMEPGQKKRELAAAALKVAQKRVSIERKLAEQQLASLANGSFVSKPPPFSPPTPRARLKVGPVSGVPALGTRIANKQSLSRVPHSVTSSISPS